MATVTSPIHTAVPPCHFREFMGACYASETECCERDSNPHCLASETNASYQLGYRSNIATDYADGFTVRFAIPVITVPCDTGLCRSLGTRTLRVCLVRAPTPPGELRSIQMERDDSLVCSLGSVALTGNYLPYPHPVRGPTYVVDNGFEPFAVLLMREPGRHGDLPFADACAYSDNSRTPLRTSQFLFVLSLPFDLGNDVCRQL